MEEMNLEEMRSQFAILKEQLTKQEIVSDRLLRETMKAKSNGIRNVKFSSYLWCSSGIYHCNLPNGSGCYCFNILPSQAYRQTQLHERRHSHHSSRDGRVQEAIHPKRLNYSPTRLHFLVHLVLL